MSYRRNRSRRSLATVAVETPARIAIVTSVRPSDALPSPARDALASGAVVVTPNNRLARHLAALLRPGAACGRTQRSGPRRPSLPWNAWLERLWLDVLAAGCRPEPPRRIAPAQSAYLWTRIVAAEGLPLHGRARRGRPRRRRRGRSRMRGAPADRAGVPGPAATTTARSSRAGRRTIARRSRELGGLDDAQLPDWLARCAPDVPAWRDASVALAGFIEFSPQQERLLAALAAAGMRIARVPTSPSAEGDAIARAARTAGATPRDEVARALAWARAARRRRSRTRRSRSPSRISNRGARRFARWPTRSCVRCCSGRGTKARRVRTTFRSAPRSSDVPLVAAALDLIALAHAPLPMARAAALLRSPLHRGWRGRLASCGRRSKRSGCAKGGASCRSPAIVAAMGAAGPRVRAAAARRRTTAPQAVTPRCRRAPGRKRGERGSRPRDGRASERFRRWSGRRERPGTNCWPSSRALGVVAPAPAPRRGDCGARRARARQGVPAGIPARADPDPRRARGRGLAVRCVVGRRARGRTLAAGAAAESAAAARVAARAQRAAIDRRARARVCARR